MTTTYGIRIADTEHAYPCDGGDTLLRAGLRAGLGIPYECNVGSCGSCKYILVEGDVEVLWEDAPGLSKRDRERGKRLACQSRARSDCVVQLPLMDAYVPQHRPRGFHGTLVGTRRVTHDMIEFRFRSDGAAAFLPGQYSLFSVPAVRGPRAYSMSNIANAEGEWQFYIRRVPGGAATSVLFDRLATGDSIEMDGPYGLAFLRAEVARDVVCIAGGSGLSPMISIARGIAAEPTMAARRVHVFYGGRGPRDICGEEALRELGGFGGRIRYHPIISMPELDEAGEWRGERGFVHEFVPKVLGDGLQDYEYYMAGPPPMVQATLTLLTVDHRVPMQQIHYDRFF